MNDSYSFTTTAPTMTNGDVLAAFTKLQKFAEEYEFIHVVGESDLDLWQAVSEAQIELRDVYHKPVFVVFEAKYPTTGDEEDEPDMMGGGDLTDWALEMEAKRKKVKNYDIQVVTAWGRLVKLDGSTQITNLAGLVCGLYGKGNYKASGKMSMLRDDYDDVLAYCKAKGVPFYGLEWPSVVVSYANEGERTRIDELKKVVPIKRSHKAAQGDKSLTVDIDLMIVGGIVEDGVEPTK